MIRQLVIFYDIIILMNVHYFDSITVRVPNEKIYARLGFAKGKTQITDSQQQTIQRHIDDAVSLIELKGSGLRLPITAIDSNKIDLAKNIHLESESLSQMLTGCKEILFIGATTGNRIMEAIQKESGTDQLSKAVVFDATASEVVDEALGWIISFFDYELRRENKSLTSRRFSAGYGDFSLENQKILYNILNLERFGVKLTKTYMLIPEKSVTAVVGIH